MIGVKNVDYQTHGLFAAMDRLMHLGGIPYISGCFARVDGFAVQAQVERLMLGSRVVANAEVVLDPDVHRLNFEKLAYRRLESANLRPSRPDEGVCIRLHAGEGGSKHCVKELIEGLALKRIVHDLAMRAALRSKVNAVWRVCEQNVSLCALHKRLHRINARTISAHQPVVAKQPNIAGLGYRDDRGFRDFIGISKPPHIQWDIQHG